MLAIVSVVAIHRSTFVARIGLPNVLPLSRERRSHCLNQLTYARSVADRVREMVRKEQRCCAFLNFDLSEIDEGVRLAITAPERARDVADALFEQVAPAGGR